MSPAFATFILMSNYFHDVATAMLLACGVVLWVLFRNLEQDRDAVLGQYVADMYRSVSRLAWFSVAWIAAGGVLRIATFQRFEWLNAAQKHLETGLLVKYGIAICMMGIGAILWAGLAGRIRKQLS